LRTLWTLSFFSLQLQLIHLYLQTVYRLQYPEIDQPFITHNTVMIKRYFYKLRPTLVSILRQHQFSRNVQLRNLPIAFQTSNFSPYAGFKTGQILFNQSETMGPRLDQSERSVSKLTSPFSCFHFILQSIAIAIAAISSHAFIFLFVGYIYIY